LVHPLPDSSQPAKIEKKVLKSAQKLGKCRFSADLPFLKKGAVQKWMNLYPVVG
jgi:hypothetical protein